MLQTVQKIGPVLDLFSARRPEWGVSEAAAELGMPRSSAHAVLSSLVETRLLKRTAGGRYRIGWRVVEMNETLRTSTDLRSIATPTLYNLVRTKGETGHLAVIESGQVLYVEKATGTLSLIVRGVTAGSLREYHCTALGKALLAERDPARERTAPKDGFRRHTSSTIVDPRRLEAELHQVRADGVAFDLGESEPDIRCVAAPIRDESGKVVAAISVTVPSSRFPQRQLELISAVKAAANEISRELVDSASGSWYDRESADQSA